MQIIRPISADKVAYYYLEMQIICCFESADNCISRNGKNRYRLCTNLGAHLPVAAPAGDAVLAGALSVRLVADLARGADGVAVARLARALVADDDKVKVEILNLNSGLR